MRVEPGPSVVSKPGETRPVQLRATDAPDDATAVEVQGTGARIVMCNFPSETRVRAFCRARIRAFARHDNARSLRPQPVWRQAILTSRSVPPPADPVPESCRDRGNKIP